MYRLLPALGLLCLLTTPVSAQNLTIVGPNPPCTAFGTTVGTCVQGNDARLGAGAVTGALKSDGSNTFGQAASTDLSDVKNGATCTAALQFGGASTGITYSTQACEFDVKGNKIEFTATLLLSSKGSATGAATVALSGTGLTGNATGFTIGIPFLVGQNLVSITSGNLLLAVMPTSGAVIHLYQIPPNSTTSALTDANFSATTQIFLQGFWYTS